MSQQTVDSTDDYADPFVDIAAPEKADDAVGESKRKPSRSRAGTGRARTSRAPKGGGAAEAVRLYITYSQLGTDELERLARLVGLDADPEALAVGVASGAKVDTSALEAVESIHGASDLAESGIRAHVLTENRKAFAKVWELVGLTTEPPRSSVDMALVLARHVAAMSDDQMDELKHTMELLGR